MARKTRNEGNINPAVPAANASGGRAIIGMPRQVVGWVTDSAGARVIPY
jgi:hypothetical protein